MNKRGLSGVVTTLIIIMLVVVAIGMIWFVIRLSIQGGLGKTQNSLACIDIDLTIDSVKCETGGGATVHITRGSDKRELSKILVKFSSKTDSTALEFVALPDRLETSSQTFTSTDLDFIPTKASVYAVIIDENNEEFVCEESDSYDTSCGNTGECGDGIVDQSEVCDDENLVVGDGCDDVCKIETSWACAGNRPSSCTTQVSGTNYYLLNTASNLVTPLVSTANQACTIVRKTCSGIFYKDCGGITDWTSTTSFSCSTPTSEYIAPLPDPGTQCLIAAECL